MHATPRQPLIVLREIHVTRTAPNGDAMELLKAASFSVAKGEITVVIGPSGGGKSTLIRLLNRLSDPTSGSISLGGVDIMKLDPLQLRRQVAAVPQKPFMFQGSVLHNLQMAFSYRSELPPAADSPIVLEALQLARLSPELLQRDARTLSVGEQQRVSVARAIVTDPQVLLLDEPTSALDRPTADQLSAALRDIARSKGMTIVLVTHDLRLAERVADYLLYLEGGRIVEQGEPAALLSAPQSPELQRFLAEPADADG